MRIGPSGKSIFDKKRPSGVNGPGEKQPSPPSIARKRIDRVLKVDDKLRTREQKRLINEGKDPKSVFLLGDEDDDLPSSRPNSLKSPVSGSIFTRALNSMSGQEKELVLHSLGNDAEQTPEDRMKVSLGKVLAAALARVQLFENGVPVIGKGIFGRDSAIIAPEGLRIFEQGAPPRDALQSDTHPDTTITFEDIAKGRVEITIDNGGRKSKPPKLIQKLIRSVGADVGTVVLKHNGEEFHFMGVPNPASVVRKLYQTATAFAGEEEAKADLRELKVQFPELFKE